MELRWRVLNKITMHILLIGCWKNVYFKSIIVALCTNSQNYDMNRRSISAESPMKYNLRCSLDCYHSDHISHLDC